MDLKQLKQLAILCRKYGIKSFKNEEFEFSLTDEDPIQQKKVAKPKKQRQESAPESPIEEKIEADSLSQEELMFWSSNVASTIENEGTA